jgi:antitoxin (DNA-binding transcriptional repressor) of toxin-antitoxin stability system
MSVRDIRQNWPEAERVLREEGEIVVTRDSKPVTRIVPIAGDRSTAAGRRDELRRIRTRSTESSCAPRLRAEDRAEGTHRIRGSREAKHGRPRLVANT